MKNRRLLGRQLLLPSTALQWTALKQTIKLFRQMLLQASKLFIFFSLGSTLLKWLIWLRVIAKILAATWTTVLYTRERGPDVICFEEKY